MKKRKNKLNLGNYILSILAIHRLTECLDDLKVIVSKLQNTTLKKYDKLKEQLLQDLQIDITNLELLIEKLEKDYEKEKKEKDN